MNIEQSQSLHCFKSSYSGGECIEVAALPHSLHVRDSKDTGRGSLTVSPASCLPSSTTPATVTDRKPASTWRDDSLDRPGGPWQHRP